MIAVDPRSKEIKVVGECRERKVLEVEHRRWKELFACDFTDLHVQVQIRRAG